MRTAQCLCLVLMLVTAGVDSWRPRVKSCSRASVVCVSMAQPSMEPLEDTFAGPSGTAFQDLRHKQAINFKDARGRRNAQFVRRANIEDAKVKDAVVVLA